MAIPASSLSMAESGHEASLHLLLINPTIVGKFEHLHIGLTTIGSYVEANSRHRVRVLDFVAHRQRWREHLATVLQEFHPDVVGIYISTPYFPSAKKIAAEIKRRDPRVRVLGGGHHATLSPDEVIAHPAFDMLIIGEGEKPVLALLDCLAEERPLTDVPGLWSKQGDEVVKTAKTTLIEAEGFPAVDWELNDEKALGESLYLWGILPVMASRGCPARCSFCSITNIQRLYPDETFLRHRDPVAVVDDIETTYFRLGENRPRIVFFYDLNFLLEPDWVRRFTDEYRRRGLNRILPWSAYSRVDHITPEVLAYLRDSGCVNLRLGIEAANPTMRNDIYRKEVSQEQLETALRAIKELGISITGYFIAGGPGDRPEWLMESLELAHRFGIEFPVFFHYKPLAGTDILDMAGGLGSSVVSDSLNEQSDYLHGVSMRHAHLRAWQLRAFVLLTQVLFGVPIVTRLAWREKLSFVPRLAAYVHRARRLGFSPYLAASYCIFYGYDHLARPVRMPLREPPSIPWRAAMWATRLWMREQKASRPCR